MSQNHHFGSTQANFDSRQTAMYHPPLMIPSSSAPLIARSFARRPYAGRIVAIGSQAFCAKACAMSSAMLDRCDRSGNQTEAASQIFQAQGTDCHVPPPPL